MLTVSRTVAVVQDPQPPTPTKTKSTWLRRTRRPAPAWPRSTCCPCTGGGLRRGAASLDDAFEDWPELLGRGVLAPQQADTGARDGFEPTDPLALGRRVDLRKRTADPECHRSVIVVGANCVEQARARGREVRNHGIGWPHFLAKSVPRSSADRPATAHTPQSAEPERGARGIGGNHDEAHRRARHAQHQGRRGALRRVSALRHAGISHWLVDLSLIDGGSRRWGHSRVGDRAGGGRTSRRMEGCSAPWRCRSWPRRQPHSSARWSSANELHGAIGLGGGTGTWLAAAVLRGAAARLPEADRLDAERARRAHRHTVMPSVVDIAGLNRCSRRYWRTPPRPSAAWRTACRRAPAGDGRHDRGDDVRRTTTGATHAPLLGEAAAKWSSSTPTAGGVTMEDLIRRGTFTAVVDWTTTDHRRAGRRDLQRRPDRLEAAGEAGIPQVVVPGAVDVINWRGESRTAGPDARALAPAERAADPDVDRRERAIGAWIADKLNGASGPCACSSRARLLGARRGAAVHDPAADEALVAALRRELRAEIPVEASRTTSTARSSPASPPTRSRPSEQEAHLSDASRPFTRARRSWRGCANRSPRDAGRRRRRSLRSDRRSAAGGRRGPDHRLQHRHLAADGPADDPHA